MQKLCKSFIVAASLMAVPASASLLDSLNSGVDYFLGLGASNINLLRLLMAVVIIAVVYESLLKALNYNKPAALVVSIILSVIGVRFMPEELLLRLATFIWVLLMFAVPYLLLGKIFPKASTRIIAALIAAIVLALLFKDYLGLSFGLYILEDAYYLIADSPYMLALVISIILVVYVAIRFLFKKKRQ